MSTSTGNCPEGFRWDTTSGTCVPSNGSGDPIKPPASSLKTSNKKPKKAK